MLFLSVLLCVLCIILFEKCLTYNNNNNPNTFGDNSTENYKYYCYNKNFEII